MIVIHGLKNCDTCKKARKWAEQEGLEHRFHDVRDRSGIGFGVPDQLVEMIGQRPDLTGLPEDQIVLADINDGQ